MTNLAQRGRQRTAASASRQVTTARAVDEIRGSQEAPRGSIAARRTAALYPFWLVVAPAIAGHETFAPKLSKGWGTMGCDYRRKAPMSTRSIQEFMWGFQPHFRSAATRFVNEALLRIGLPAAPEVILVGFREAGAGPHPICVEPEDGEYPSSLLTSAMAEAEREFEASPERNLFTTNPRLQATRVRNSRENSRRAAIESALADSPSGAARYFFAGRPARVADYRVYPVVAVLKSRWDSAPAFPAEIPPVVPVAGSRGYPQSLQHAVVRRALSEMTLALELTSEPEGLRDWMSDLVPETVRSAANELLRGIVTSYGNVYGGDLFNAMNAVSAQPYEGRTGVGTLLLGKHQSGHFDVDIDFKTGVRLDETRALRKALEMTGPNLALLTDGAVATGLGHARTDQAVEGVFEITVTGRGQWGFGTRELALLAVDNGSPSLPRDRISKEAFLDAVDRVFEGVGDGDALWALTEAASRQQHGTMLVIRVDADAEAERLAPQALAITPRRLDPLSLASLTAIDGAILVAPDAQCHAVGVILDGQAAAGVGDPSRGARYNSALRYHQGAAEGTTLIVIVSEDGMINLLPNLRRRVSRSAVETAVRELVGAAVEPVVFEQAAKKSAHVRSLAFYLSEEQTQQANAAFEAIERARENSLRPGESGITRVGYDELVPDPEMNDDYFLD